jgi:hypothetical protein
MCRVIAELHSVTQKPTGRVAGHAGLCMNGLTFDVHEGLVFLCAHPDNDPNQPPTFTRTLSVAAWQEIVAHIASELPGTTSG